MVHSWNTHDAYLKLNENNEFRAYVDRYKIQEVLYGSLTEVNEILDVTDRNNDYRYCVIQCNFKFYLMPIFSGVCKQSVRSTYKFMEKYFLNDKLDYDYFDDKIFNLLFFKYQRGEYRDIKYYDLMDLKEVCFKGFSTCVYNENGNDFVNLDLNEYENNYNEFLKYLKTFKDKDRFEILKSQLDYLYYINTNCLANFFMVKIKQLKNKRFNRIEAMSKVLKQRTILKQKSYY